MQQDILKIQDLSLRYTRGGRSARVLDGVSLSIPAGTSLGVVGESGCGKSTLAKAVIRLLPDNAVIKQVHPGTYCLQWPRTGTVSFRVKRKEAY